MSEEERGQRDCEQGTPAELNASDGYNEGYGLQYETEAIDNHNLDIIEGQA